jgi:hypothetical protein
MSTTSNPQPAAPSYAEAPLKEVEVLAQEAFFMNDCVLVKMSNGMERTVSYEAFLGVIRRASNAVEQVKSEGFSLPSNTFFFGKNGDSLNISGYYGSKVNQLLYYDKKMEILTPNIIISHVLRKGRAAGEWKMESSKFFCTDVSVGGLPKEFIYETNSAKQHLHRRKYVLWWKSDAAGFQRKQSACVGLVLSVSVELSI